MEGIVSEDGLQHDCASPVVSHEDMERVRIRLGLSVEGMCKYLCVTRTTYWRWQKRGIFGPAQQLIRVMDAFPKVVLGTLAPEED